MIKVKKIAYLAVIVISILSCATLWKYRMIDLDISNFHINDFLKYTFLMCERNSQYFYEISPIVFVSFFAVVLFSLYYILESLWGINAKYRSLIMQRYKNKTQFINSYIKRAIFSSITASSVMVISLMLGTILQNRSGLVCSYKFLITMLLTALGLILFLNTISLVGIFCILKYNDVISNVAVSFLICTFLFVDIKLSRFHLVTYCSDRLKIYGLAFQAVVYILGVIVLKKYFKKKDIL